MKEFIHEHKKEIILASVYYLAVLNLVKAANQKTIHIITH